MGFGRAQLLINSIVGQLLFLRLQNGLQTLFKQIPTKKKKYNCFFLFTAVEFWPEYYLDQQNFSFIFFSPQGSLCKFHLLLLDG